MDKGMEEFILRPTCDARDQSLALGEAGGVDRGKHTPGQWSIDPMRAVTVLAGDLVLARAYAVRGSREAANARLIAAAPDLLAALMAAEGPLRYAYHNVASVTADRVKAEILPAISAAIAKATKPT